MGRPRKAPSSGKRFLPPFGEGPAAPSGVARFRQRLLRETPIRGLTVTWEDSLPPAVHRVGQAGSRRRRSGPRACPKDRKKDKKSKKTKRKKQQKWLKNKENNTKKNKETKRKTKLKKIKKNQKQKVR